MKKLLLLLSLTFIPVLNAQTYYDYEKVEVEELPTASAETTDKVYIVGNSYYVTEKTLGSVTPMVIGNNMKGVTLYNAIPDNLMELDIWKNLDSCKSHYYCKGHIFNYDSNPSPLTFFVDFSNNKFILYFNGKGHQDSQLIIENNVVTKAFTSSVYEYDLVFTTKYYEYTVNGLPELAAFLDYIYEHVSTSSIDTTYSWKEVRKSDVYEITVKDDDFYFFFSYNDISNFNILSSYDFTNFTDFEKIVIVLGFNIFFLMFLGFIVYIFIKLVNKGITLLFR